MRIAPSGFRRRLEREFGGRLRIRWSTQRGEWHVEQKVARAMLPTRYTTSNDDLAIRVWDGYDFLLAIREGDRMPCPRDGTTLKVPLMATGEAVCPVCRSVGREGRFAAAYFPLDGDALIQYLRRLDPLLGWRDRDGKAVDRAEARVQARHERTLSNTIEAATKDHWMRLAGIPHVGYTGREKAWER